mmetsp:Transcript_22496/g.69695  ORF Transcript_22496/g.69695 Transcript_22496/m.69695 type:complete len:330 (-) Transcript_22496:835-1824(-)
MRRKGKQLWFELSGAGKHPLFHFGMTGAFAIEGRDRMKYKSFTVGDVWPPRFTKVELHFAGDAAPVKLAFCDPRRFGRILLRAAPVVAKAPVAALAPDPVAAMPAPEAFAAALGAISAPIKAALLNQTSVVCGVGNWVADEVLFQAGIHPAAPARTLSRRQCDALRGTIATVLELACEARADYALFPEDWLFHRRWGKGKDGKAMPNGDRIIFDEVGGRTTAIVPRVQKKGEVAARAAKGKPKKTKTERARKADDIPAAKPQKKRGRAAKPETAVQVTPGPASKRRRQETKPKPKSKAKLPKRIKAEASADADTDMTPGRRRSARLRRS